MSAFQNGDDVEVLDPEGGPLFQATFIRRSGGKALVDKDNEGKVVVPYEQITRVN